MQYSASEEPVSSQKAARALWNMYLAEKTSYLAFDCNRRNAPLPQEGHRDRRNAPLPQEGHGGATRCIRRTGRGDHRCIAASCVSCSVLSVYLPCCFPCCLLSFLASTAARGRAERTGGASQRAALRCSVLCAFVSFRLLSFPFVSFRFVSFPFFAPSFPLCSPLRCFPFLCLLSLLSFVACALGFLCRFCAAKKATAGATSKAAGADPRREQQVQGRSSRSKAEAADPARTRGRQRAQQLGIGTAGP